MEWRDTVTDTKALLSGVTSDMNVYAAYTESVMHTTRLTLEYYTVSDLEKGEYDTVPYATVVTDYNAEIKTSSYIPEDKIIHITTADGERIQTWSFDKWESDLEYQLTGIFTGTDNVTVKLYATYKLASESYISTEELDRIYIAKQPDKTSYIVNECFDKTGLVVDAVYKQTWNDGHVTYRTEYNLSLIHI